MTEHGTNDPSGLEVEPSTAGATLPGDLGWVGWSAPIWVTGPDQGWWIYDRMAGVWYHLELEFGGPSVNESYRRTNDPRPLEVEPSTAGASGGRDLGSIEVSSDAFPLLTIPCPASIWLLGGAANCSREKGHDGFHAVTIQWSVG